MDDLRNIVGHGRNMDNSLWYIVSDRSMATGQLTPKSGQRVTITPNTYCHRCSQEQCGHLDFAAELEKILDQELAEAIEQKFSWLEINGQSYDCTCRSFKTLPDQDCVHILSLKHFEEELKTNREHIVPQKEEEITRLTGHIKQLESKAKEYSQDKTALEEQIKELESGIESAEERARSQLENEIKVLKENYQTANDLSQRNDEERQQAQAQLKDEKAELRQYVSILEEENDRLEKDRIRLEQAVAREIQGKQKAALTAEGLSSQRFAALYSLSRNLQNYVLALAEMEPDKITELLAPVIYAQIPASQKQPSEKIQLGTKEHHHPRGYDSFLEKIARIETVNQIKPSWSESTPETGLKNIYRPNETMPTGQPADCWTILMVYSGGDFGCRLYVETTARNKVEVELIAKEVLKKF